MPSPAHARSKARDILPKPKQGEVSVVLLNCGTLAPHERTALKLVTERRRTAIEKRSDQTDRLHALAAGLLLHYFLGVETDEQLIYSEYGKPSLRSGGGCFNLSHGGEYAVLALYPSPVGIDIEPIQPIDPYIVKYFFSEEEKASLEGENSDMMFTKLWTKKESILKADGRGFLDSVEQILQDKDRQWRTQTAFYQNHVLTCAAKDLSAMHLVEVPVKLLIESEMNRGDKWTEMPLRNG